MGTVFWDAEGLILAEVLEPGQNITAARYVQTLHKLRRALRDKRPGRNKLPERWEKCIQRSGDYVEK